jgi:hypothetical protein
MQLNVILAWANLAVFLALSTYTGPAFFRVVSGRVKQHLDLIKSAFLMMAINRSFYAVTSVFAPHPHGGAGYQARMALAAFSLVCGIGAIYALRLSDRVKA